MAKTLFNAGGTAELMICSVPEYDRYSGAVFLCWIAIGSGIVGK